MKTLITERDWSILHKSIQKNVDRFVQEIVKRHEKKLRNLTKNSTLPFTKDEAITNISSYSLSDEESDLLKHGLTYAVPPKRVCKADVFTTFEMISQFLTKNLKKEDLQDGLKAELSFLANS